ncbi:hypothetical protein GPL29_18540 [Bacteroides caccae]|uniref:hypothetical protein n=1 Tax=Bacteroides caccae TaxID=47678 RepID=UPI001C02C96A|nr:hypothetical protein [Bacteroides caccae]MBT9927150.1 hypothetical protein [Bacteroides caccae]
MSRISSVCNSSAGRFAPLHGADGEADRREFPMFRKAQTVSRARRQAQPAGSTSTRDRSENHRDWD